MYLKPPDNRFKKIILQVVRKISKCGYLFVAPQDWDWSNPLYRTKVRN